MEVNCPKCGVTIEANVTSFHPFRWATNDLLPRALMACEEWRDLTNDKVEAKPTIAKPYRLPWKKRQYL